jgi:Tfp pilus tip-associated adhesin PilY1
VGVKKSGIPLSCKYIPPPPNPLPRGEGEFLDGHSLGGTIMKRLKHYFFTSLLFVSCFIFVCTPGLADDTCVFMQTADNVAPNIVLLLDNGAEMEQVIWHDGYDNNTDYTPDVGAEEEFVNGFFNEYGYSVYKKSTSDYYIRPIVYETLLPGDLGDSLQSATNTFEINGRSVALPFEASTVVIDGAIDNAVRLRYSKNYLNWIFFGSYAGNGSDLSSESRFYYAKQAIRTVLMATENKAKFGIYYFTNVDGSTQKQPLKFALQDDGSLTSEFENNINGMHTANHSPLAEGLAEIGGYYDSPASGVEDPVEYYCQKQFVIVISPGVSSEDQDGHSTYLPETLSDHDGDGDAGGIGEGNIKAASAGTLTLNPTSGNFVNNEVLKGGTSDATANVDGVRGSLLDYNAKTGDFSVDEVVTGQTSSATGTITAIDTSITSPTPIPTNVLGSTYLDDVAHYMYTHDMVGYRDGFQNVSTYTIGFMGDRLSNLFLINTSNNGNGNVNLYDTSDPDYGKYHFTADSPGALSSTLLEAINAILSETSSFTAPVVPVTRTTSGNRIYMAFFKPGASNFWEGNVTKFGISSANQIMNADPDPTDAVDPGPATYPNGAMRDDAVPYWATITWSAEDAPDPPQQDNRILNLDDRNIYTYMGSTTDLTDDTEGSSNAFKSDNTLITAAILGNPTYTTAQIINYVRGQDVLDEDEDGHTDDTRTVITGDVLHSEPLVVYYNETTTMVYFGSNDGMLHAVNDSDGKEAWAFIPPDQLHRLKDMVEGSSHEFYVDSSPKAYINDANSDGKIDPADGDQVILICGERKGGTSYFALDVTTPSAPVFKWRISQYDDTQIGSVVLTDVIGTWHDNYAAAVVDPVTFAWLGRNIIVYGEPAVENVLNFDSMLGYINVGDRVRAWTSADGFLDVYGTIASVYYNAPPGTEPIVISELGESWSEPQFGLVKDNFGADTPVFFIGGGYSSTNSAGCAVLAVNVDTGAVVKKFYDDGVNHDAMDYSFASSVTLVDSNSNGYVDKVYAGDVGGQMWRFGNFDGLTFPNGDEDITTWTGQVLFDSTNVRKFFYPPAVTLEKGYHLVFMGTGDREDACSTTSSDRIYCVKDTHDTTTTLNEGSAHMVDVTTPAPVGPLPDLNGTDQGWYLPLAAGEKVLAEGTVFYKTLYTTTFTPNDDVCVPGGEGKLYALNYLTGQAVLDFVGDPEDKERCVSIGGSIPSKPVMVITSTGEKLFISVGSTNPDATSEDFGAGIVAIDPLSPPANYFLLWWRELFD